MSQPPNQFHHERNKPISSSVAAGPSSPSPSNWRSPQNNPPGHVAPVQNSTASSPPPQPETLRPRQPLEPLPSFGARPFWYPGPPFEPPTFNPSDYPWPLAESTAAQGHEAPAGPMDYDFRQFQAFAMDFDFRQFPQYTPVPQGQPVYAPAGNGPDFAPSVPMQMFGRFQPMTLEETQNTPGSATPDSNVDSSVRRSTRRRPPNAETNRPVYEAGGQNLPQSQSSREVSNRPPAEPNVPQASFASYGQDFYYPGYFTPSRPDATNFHVPNYTLDPDTGVPLSDSAMPLSSHHYQPSEFMGSFSPTEPSNPGPQATPGNPSAMTTAPRPRYQPADVLMQMYNQELHQRPRQPSAPNRPRNRTTAREISPTSARRQELIDARIRELRMLRARGGFQRSPPRRPPPATVQHFTTLSAADPSHDVDCPICHEPYDDDNHPAIRLQKVSCTHVFGRGCLQEWCNSGMDNAHKCPSCRSSIAGALTVTPVPPRPAPDVTMPPRPDFAAARRGDGAELTQAERVAFQQRMEGQMLSPNSWANQPMMTASSMAPRSAVPMSMQARDQIYQAPGQSGPTPQERLMTFQRQQMARFDAEAANRVFAARSSGGAREAHAVLAQVAEERTALLRRQQLQLRAFEGEGEGEGNEMARRG